MISFLARRLAYAILILLILSVCMYVLIDLAIDPLADLRTSTSPDKAQLIANRIAQLNLDKPVLLRYLWWLGGVGGCFIGRCNLGVAWRENQQVTEQLQGAMAQTFELVFAATIIAIVLGVAVGLISALRQYTGFDYFITFISFVMFSLPIFWVAVLLKQYLAIGFNNFVNTPGLNWPIVVLVALLMGLFWMGALGGNARRRIITYVAATLITFVVELYILLTGWFDSPHIGIIGVIVIAAASAIVVTFLSTGLNNKRALYSALTTAAIGVVLYYPLQYFFDGIVVNIWIIIALFFVTIGIGLLVGYVFAGPDRSQSMRGAVLTGILISIVIFIDRVMQVWAPYTNSSVIGNRPIATIGSTTPNLGGDFWVHTLDIFTHLLLPSLALILITFAQFTRFTRGSMLEVMTQDYIRTARAKGLTERTVIMRHAMRNALLPLASIVPVAIITLVGGAVITETIFGWYGMGRLFVDSLGEAEIDPVMAYIIIVGALAMFANLVADFCYALLDPRIRVNS
ncbi:ABC transporter permease [Spelaeicoccus albus]|uniref:Peptide/nickel transport system permease protein n=1 Tax=Spelaeicoccus albus TaxID=1280376 RepID=A0A7Z0D388_9MICO|nr:ABC transporter permease [Spelaeicoccus albus]NYI68064.1 peptide/nickel transport system permease protein [Spelaeicoccus albus]